MPTSLQALLVGVLILAASVWLGGVVVLVVFSRASRTALDPADRIALFRRVGRAFLPVAVGAMVVVLLTGGALLAARPWDGLATTLAVLAAATIAVTALGVRQARAMTRLRRAALATPTPQLHAQVTHAARRATALRTLITALALAVYVVAIWTASR